MRKFCLLPILALFFSAFIVGNSEAATYYVDGSNGKDSNPGSLALPWKTIGKANSTLQAGDTVYLRGGTYTSEQIRPSNSGTSGNHITYQNYNGESVTLSGHSVLLYLYGNDYIKIDGLRMENCKKYFVLLGGAHYNIIQNCTFYNAASYWGAAFCKWYINSNGGGWDWRTTPLDIPNNYNQILNNTFEDAPDRCDDGSDQDCDTAPADSLRIYCGAYNLIQGNMFGNTSHTSLAINQRITNNNVIRNNVFQNTYRRGLEVGISTYRNLVENNVFYDHGLNAADNPRLYSRSRAPYNQLGIQCWSYASYNIFRRNIFDNNGLAMSQSGQHLYIYHNTANKQYVSISPMASDADEQNTFKNNIFANTQLLGWEEGEPETYSYNWLSYSGTGKDVITNCKITHNAFSGTIQRWRWMYKSYSFADWENATSQIYDNFWSPPGFRDENNRDFTLQSKSQLIDAGDWLTMITSSTATGVSSFTVDDAGYFYDGWSVPGQIGDVIKTANGKVTTITKVDYDRNRITVSPAIDIVNGEGLSLNYSGSAPDIGAHEYGSAIARPTGLGLSSGN